MEGKIYAKITITVQVGNNKNIYFGEVRGEEEHDFSLPFAAADAIDLNKVLPAMINTAYDDYRDKWIAEDAKEQDLA